MIFPDQINFMTFHVSRNLNKIEMQKRPNNFSTNLTVFCSHVPSSFCSETF